MFFIHRNLHFILILHAEIYPITVLNKHIFFKTYYFLNNNLNCFFLNKKIKNIYYFDIFSN